MFENFNGSKNMFKNFNGSKEMFMVSEDMFEMNVQSCSLIAGNV